MPGHYLEKAKKKENERKRQCQSDQQRKADRNKKKRIKIWLHQAKTIVSKLTISNKKTTDYTAEKSVKYAKITYEQQAS